MGEYDLCVNMNYGCIWIMGEYDLCLNMNCGWIWILGGDTDRQTDRHTHQYHVRPGLGAGPSENVLVICDPGVCNELIWQKCYSEERVWLAGDVILFGQKQHVDSFLLHPGIKKKVFPGRFYYLILLLFFDSTFHQNLSYEPLIVLL